MGEQLGNLDNLMGTHWEQGRKEKKITFVAVPPRKNPTKTCELLHHPNWLWNLE
jgi:hypothetical protein